MSANPGLLSPPGERVRAGRSSPEQRPGGAARELTAALCLLLFAASASTASASTASTSTASTEGGPPRPLNLLLITVDTLRPDALGWVAPGNSTPGNSTPSNSTPGNSTPAVDALAAEGFSFSAAVSPAPVTQPAHASLFTGLIPRRHGVRDNGQVLGDKPATLAEHLQQAGYATAAFVSGHPLAAGYGLERGFEHYDDRLTGGRPDRLERPAAETTAAALGWLAAAREPWFLWVHYWDAHDPYTPPPGFARPGPRGAYHGEVAYVDRAVGALRRGLAAGSRAGGEVLTVLAADHGESLGEHGEQTHGFFIYQSTVAVPLIFHLPGRVAPASSEANPGLVDVAPTILELLGQPPLSAGAGAAEIDGVSLASLLSGSPQELPPVYVESRRPWLSYGWSPLRAVRHGAWKLIAAPRPELYDLERDPGETNNLIDLERAKARELAAFLHRTEARPAVSSVAMSDPQALAKLRALGYTSAGTSAGEPPPGLADPKDRLASWNALSRAMELLEQGDITAAVAGFDTVLRQEPDNPFALSRSGAALSAARDFAGAARRLSRAARLRPQDAETRGALAVALSRGGHHGEASSHWLELVRLQPRRLDAWVNLATSLGRSGKSAEAVRALAHAVELAPERTDLRIRLAFIQHSVGNAGEAVRHLRLAARATGPEAFAHAGALGLLLARTGHPEDAVPWLRRGRREEADFAEARFELARLEAAGGERGAAQRNLRLALSAAPRLRPRAEADPLLADLLP